MKYESSQVGWYDRKDYTQEELWKKYGNNWMSRYGMSEKDFKEDYLGEDLLKDLNNANHKIFLENFDKIPMGLEKKIHLCWFQHCFSWNKIDDFHFSKLFNGNWLEVPFPNATSIECDGMETKLEDPCYNWYELFILMNDIMFRYGRLADCGITNIYMKKDKNKKISFDWGS